MADDKEKKVAKTKADDKKKTETKSTAKKATTTTKKATTEKKTEAKAESKASVKSEAKNKTASKSEAKVENKEVAKKVTSSKVNDNNDELVAKATVKYERISSRKIAIVANLIRGKNVDEAMAILKFTPKAGAEVLTKLLKSAIANAENNNQMTHSKLYIAEIYSNQGPTLKRIRAAAKGSAVRIRKRTSNTTIVLKEREA